MPKSIFIDPKEVRKPQVLKIKDIPVNQYKSDIKKEVKKLGKEKLLKIYYDILIIREFENKTVALLAKERNSDPWETYLNIIQEDPDSRGDRAAPAQPGR